jgi:hypothetical protein
VSVSTTRGDVSRDVSRSVLAAGDAIVTVAICLGGDRISSNFWPARWPAIAIDRARASHISSPVIRGWPRNSA